MRYATSAETTTLTRFILGVVHILPVCSDVVIQLDDVSANRVQFSKPVLIIFLDEIVEALASILVGFKWCDRWRKKGRVHRAHYLVSVRSSRKLERHNAFIVRSGFRLGRRDVCFDISLAFVLART